MAEPGPSASGAPSDPSPAEPRGLLDRIERLGNALPDPMTLFLLGTVAVFVASAIVAGAGGHSVLRDAAGAVTKEASAVNLLTADGFRWLSTNLVDIFVGFAPLGLVLSAAIGISLAEKSGFITAALKSILVVVPRGLLTPATFFAGVMSSMAIDAGYIVLPPLAAAIYKAIGRSPLVGLAAVFAGVASGFNANLFVTGLDPLLSGVSEESARILDPEYAVNPACNWYFGVASTVLISLVGWLVSARLVEPRLARKAPEEGGPGGAAEAMDLALEPKEVRGLAWAAASIAVTLLAVLACWYFPWGFLYDAPGSLKQDGGTQDFQTWVQAIVPLLIVFFAVPGLAYGLATGSIRSDRDVVKMMSEYMAVLGNYVVLAFFAAIFVDAFAHSNLGLMLAIEGGHFPQRFELPSSALMLAFIVVISFINLFVGSMSAKWAMLATVFVPMFMTLGISPELVQVSYRIGDSCTNSITPLNPYLVIVLVFLQQHVKHAGLGTLIALMLPYCLVFAVAWSILLVVWIQLGLPLGPDGPLTYLAP